MPRNSGKWQGVACVQTTFSSICIWYFDIWGLADPEGIAPFWVGQFLEIVNDSPSRAPFIGKPTHLEPTPQPRHLTTRDSPSTQEPTEMIPTSQTEACLHFFAPSFPQKTRVALAHIFSVRPAPWPPLVLRHVASAVCWACLEGSVSINLFFPDSHFHVCVSHHIWFKTNLAYHESSLVHGCRTSGVQSIDMTSYTKGMPGGRDMPVCCSYKTRLIST